MLGGGRSGEGEAMGSGGRRVEVREARRGEGEVGGASDCLHERYSGRGLTNLFPAKTILRWITRLGPSPPM